MDLNMTEFQKLGPNVTGFELINRSDPAVVKINQDWLDFDSKDLKLARRSLRVSPDQPHILSKTHKHTPGSKSFTSDSEHKRGGHVN